MGPLQVRQHGLPVAVPGAKPRAILTMLGLHGGSVVSADTLAELLWGARPPRTAAKALQTHISSLRRALGDGFVLTEGSGWILSTTEIDATRYKSAAKLGRNAIAGGDAGHAVARFDEALSLWRGVPELPDGPRAGSEKTRWIEGHAALVEDRADALLATGRAAEIIGELEAAIADAPLRERRWGQLMLALYRAGRQGEALAAYQRARSMLADELGVDPGPNLRRLEAAIVAQDPALEIPVSQQLSTVTKAVTFLLTDIEGSTAAWEAQPDAMAVALARHDEIVEQVVTSRGGRLVKTRGEGDATFSVFDRPSAAAAAAIQLQEAIAHEPWALAEPMRIRVALHTGEVELRDGDYFGRAVNRAARLRSLAAGGQILCSGATAELVIDSLAEDVVLADLGMRQLRNLARPEHVFELRLETADDAPAQPTEPSIQRPDLPAVLTGAGPFVGRGRELAGLLAAWQSTLAIGTQAVLVAGEPGVGKTRLAGEWSRQAYEQGAVVLYGRCDEDLGAAYQPFAEALRLLVPCLGAKRLRALRGVEALLPLVAGLTEVVPDLPTPPRSDPDTERYALFDAVVALLAAASNSAPVVLILDDLHWAAKPTLLLLRHLLRFGEHARVQIVGTYRSTDLDRSHPLAAMLADLHRDGSATRLALSGLDEDDVTAYVAEAGYDDEELARALASVTGGNPFFLIEALRHVDESGGRWDPSTLPQGVREAVSRRLSRLPLETNKALAAAAVVGSRFPLALVESVVGDDLIDAFDEACKAGIVIEEPGGRYRFNHALVRQSLLAELASVRRMRLHQKIAATLEAEAGADDDELLAELAYHYFECAWAGNAAKAVEYCRRAADQAMARLAYEGAADLFDKALHALEELDEELSDRDALQAELLVARCEALLAAGDVVSAAGAVAQLQRAAGDSVRLAAWGTCFDGELLMLTHPERLDEIEAAVAAAAEKLAGLEDAAGEAKAHTVRAACLARLGRIGDAETALDQALTAARRAHEHRRVNAVLAGAPLAALWGPNPVPRAGGRCLDVVRLLRITTGSPVVEATSTRCQGVLDALRGRAAAGRALIDSARRSLTELGMRHALLEVDQFAGIVELVADDAAAAEPLLRRAYDGFRRMGLDADTAETAALLARACLALDRDAEADELCSESERLAGHALKPSIAWRTVRAQLLARNGTHDEAKRVALEAVAVAERTDLLVDHGDACLALATVLGIAGDVAGARAAAERAAELYELKGAAALAAKAHGIVGTRISPVVSMPDLPRAEPENECVRLLRRLDAAYDREAWDEVAQLVADVVHNESRRRIVGLEPLDRPRAEWVAGAQQYRETLAPVRYRHSVVAVRGDRLALSRLEVGPEDLSPGAPRDELLQLYGLDENGRLALQIWFDVQDIDAAMAELDVLQAGFELENECVRVLRRVEDAVSRRAWSEVEREHAPLGSIESRRKIVGFKRIELPASAMASGADRFIRDMRAVQRRRPIIAIRGERLALTRTVVGTADDTPGAPQDEMLQLVGLDEDSRIAQQVWFDVEDMDAAMAELDAAHARLEEVPPTTRLENAATRADDRGYALFTEGRLDEIAALYAVDIRIEDRRKGLARESLGRAAALENVRAIADFDMVIVHTPLAVRGDRLSLTHVRFQQRDGRPGAYYAESLEINEIGADGLMTARVVFDADDVEASFQELDARYVAREAAAHAHTWSVIADTFVAVSHDEVPAMSPDCITLDHRRTRNFAPGDLQAYLQAGHDLDQHIKAQVQVVHRLNHLGAVVGYAAYARSREGFDAEWREVSLSIVDGGMVIRCELFEDTDLDTALARFDALTRSAPQLENAASRVNNHFDACLAARDWEAMAAVVAEDMCNDDRRRVVGAGIRRGRHDEIADMQAIAELGVASAVSTVVATRGERLALLRTRFSGREQGPEAFHTDIVDIIEINADDQITRRIAFDADDIDAAFEELDSLYLAGEAAAHAKTWSVVVGVYAALARHEVPAATPDWTYVDHRRGTPLADTDLREIVSTLNELTPNLTNHVESVHALHDHAALVTQVSRGTSPEGFDAEWRMVNLLTVQGDKVSRCELFDESDIEAALARFDELCGPGSRFVNPAAEVYERFWSAVGAKDWTALAEILAADTVFDDRRKIVNAGIRYGRNAGIADMRAVAELWNENLTTTLTAVRGDRLAMSIVRSSATDSEVFNIVEIDDDNRIAALVAIDGDNIDGAFEELDARYLAGEAAVHAQTWSVIVRNAAAFNNHELPTWTRDVEHLDHRKVMGFVSGDETAYVHATWDQTPDLRLRIEAVHRLNDCGAVVTYSASGTSAEDFQAEWRGINVSMINRDRINHSELFDEADLDAALARFEELSSEQRLENAASKAEQRALECFATRDWVSMAQYLAEDLALDDRRRVVNAGTRRGRNAAIADARAVADLGGTEITSEVIATRGNRLFLARSHLSSRGQESERFHTESLCVASSDDDGRIAARVVFDPDDINAALTELDARYVAGEAKPYARVWSVITDAYAALNRHELAPTPPDWVYVDHHRPALWQGDFTANMRAAWEVAPDWHIDIVAVHRLTRLGAVLTCVARGTSREGFDGEQPGIALLTVQGEVVNRFEYYGEADLDDALAHFDELSRRAKQPENLATRLYARLNDAFMARDWNTMATLVADDTSTDDRRPIVGLGLRRGRDAAVGDWRAIADVGVKDITATVIATRGERLALSRYGFVGHDQRPEAYRTEVLGIVEIDGDQRMSACVMLDLSDIDTAFAELDARYAAGDAAPHAHTWELATKIFAAMNRSRLPAASPNWVVNDHRRLPMIQEASRDAYLSAAIEVPQSAVYIEAVHKLSDAGAVLSWQGDWTTPDGFDAQWRGISVTIFEDDLIDRVEIFDEDDLDAALATFDELTRTGNQLNNAAIRGDTQAADAFNNRDLDGYLAAFDGTARYEDRRKGLRNEGPVDRELAHGLLFTGAPSWCVEIAPVAIRGRHLALTRHICRDSGEAERPIVAEVLALVEATENELICRSILFDPGDINAAFAELDTRWIVGEAADHAQTWSVITHGFAGFGNHELPPMAFKWIDHRQVIGSGSSDLTETTLAAWDMTLDIQARIEAVHRLNDRGAVVTHSVQGTSRDGFDFELRMVDVFMVEGGVISRCESFDESDLKVALGRFDELTANAPLLTNAVARILARVVDAFSRRDPDGYIALFAEDCMYEDRRKGLRDAGSIRPEYAQTVTFGAAAGWQPEFEPIAVRGEHLMLGRVTFRDQSEAGSPIAVEALNVGRLSDDELISWFAVFDPEDIDAAYAELDAHWVASGEVSNPEVIESMNQLYDCANRHDWDALAARESDATFVNHRQLGTGEQIGDHWSSIRTMASLIPDMRIEVAEIPRHSAKGVVTSLVVKGTAVGGTAIELPAVIVLLFDGPRVTRMEAFDLNQRDQALARFDELNC